MKYLKINELKNRKKFKKFEKKLIVLRCLFLVKRLHFSFKKQLLKRWFNICKVDNLFIFKNRCLFSNRGSSIYRDFGLSRLELRRMASKGLINGLQKSSW